MHAALSVGSLPRMEGQGEAELVEGLRRGDPRAFDAVYDAYRPRVFGFLARLTGRRDLAEDLLQETFLRLARHGPGLREDTRLAPWLFKVAHNLWRSHRRWVLIDLDRLQKLSLWSSLDEPQESPFELTTASELQRRLERALARLPEKYREPLLLVAVEKMEPRDAAEVMGMKPEALRQRLTRARAKLSDYISREE